MHSIDDIQADLAAFSLGGALPSSLREVAGGHLIQWTDRRGALRSTQVAEKDGEWFVILEEGSVSYRSYLASDDVADLSVLARRTLERVPTTPGYTDVEVTAEADDAAGAGNGMRRQGVPRLLQEISDRVATDLGRTQVFFLRGAAGAGKSAMLREAARQLADRWLCGNQRGPLALYVDAQAKALLSLDDAFASVLADLDVLTIRKEAVAVLCRHGLLVPCIDGFDELLGAGGFGDAFNSLSSFLGRLNGAGTVLASGRSTFYDQEQLQITATRYLDTDYRTTTLTVHPWSTDMVRVFCRARWKERAEADELSKSLDRLLRNDHTASLLGKPFFAAQVAEMMPAEGFDEKRSMIDQLVGQLLVREAPKWVDRNKELVFTPAQHEALLRDVALEMWWANIQELDIEAVRLLADIHAQSVGLDHRPIVLAKAATHGAFESAGEKRNLLRFQHPIYFDYFLSKELIDLVMSGGRSKLLAMLERGVLGESVMNVLGELSAAWNTEKVASSINEISGSLRSEGRYHAARMNGGAIVAALLDQRRDVVADVELRHLVFQRVHLTDVTLTEAFFEACAFEDAFLHGLVLDGCVFDACVIRRGRVGRGTRFTTNILDGCQVVSLIDDDGGGRVVAAPDQVLELLRKHGMPVPPQAPRELTETQRRRRDALDRLLRKLDRHYYFGEDLEQKWGLHGNPEWGVVREALLATGVAERRSLSKRGPDGTLLAFRFTASQVRDGESRAAQTPQPIRDLWDLIDA